MLGSRLLEISTTLLGLASGNTSAVMGSSDDLRLRSCMTLFAALPGAPSVFEQVLDKIFGSAQDEKTLRILTGQG